MEIKAYKLEDYLFEFIKDKIRDTNIEPTCILLEYNLFNEYYKYIVHKNNQSYFNLENNTINLNFMGYPIYEVINLPLYTVKII